MINTNELRIGNLVNIKGFDVEFHASEVTSIMPNEALVQVIGKGEIDFSANNLIPDIALLAIPLTEEWLVKFGIDKKSEYPYRILGGYIKIRNGVYFIKYYNLEIELQFVHQLQNLYFALTGTELKII